MSLQRLPTNHVAQSASLYCTSSSAPSRPPPQALPPQHEALPPQHVFESLVHEGVRPSPAIQPPSPPRAQCEHSIGPSAAAATCRQPPAPPSSTTLSPAKAPEKLKPQPTASVSLAQAKRRLKMEQQQQQQQRDHGDAACAASTSAFSSRLGAVVALADSALRDINVGFAKTSSTEAAVAQMMGKSFEVGSLKCSGCAVVQFYKSWMQYTIMHPEEGTVTMLMHYAHLSDVSFNSASARVSFRVPRPLQHFVKHYDHTSAASFLSFELADVKDRAKFKARVAPLMPGCALH